MKRMRWKKLGRLFCPDRQADWMVSHAANPTVEPGEGSAVQVYFSCRDAENRSSVARLAFDLGDPPNSVQLHPAPVIAPGARGLFDDSGASVGCVVEEAERLFLYYVGWNLGMTVPWRNSIGLAIREVGTSAFVKYSRAPVLDRSNVDPFSLSYPWVCREGEIWRMWYGSNDTWGATPTEMLHVIRYAESADGIHWHATGHVAIPLAGGEEFGVARPCVIRHGGRYRMWYAVRSHRRYRIGYAESADGLRWERMDDQAGIDVSDAGWDSEMIEYPCVFEREGTLYMLYNGNGYGKTGLGLAVMDADA